MLPTWRPAPACGAGAAVPSAAVGTAVAGASAASPPRCSRTSPLSRVVGRWPFGLVNPSASGSSRLAGCQASRPWRSASRSRSESVHSLPPESVKDTVPAPCVAWAIA